MEVCRSRLRFMNLCLLMNVVEIDNVLKTLQYWELPSPNSKVVLNHDVGQINFVQWWCQFFHMGTRNKRIANHPW